MSGLINPTAEKLRSKHIRTLEAFQKVVNENKELTAKLKRLGGDGDAGQVDAEHVAELRDLLAAAEARVEELELKVDTSDAAHAREVEELDLNWTSRLAQVQQRLQEGQADWQQQRRSLQAQVSRQSQELLKLRQAVAEVPETAAPAPAPQVADGGCQVDLGADAEAEALAQAARLEQQLADMRRQGDGKVARVQAQLEASEARLLELARRAEEWEARQAKPAVPAELPEPKAPAEAKRLRKEIQRLRAALEASNKEFEMAAADAKMWAGRAANEQSVVHKYKELLAKAQADLAAAARRGSGSGSGSGSGGSARSLGGKFAEHVKLGRENQALRAQVEALKAERKKFVQKLRRGKVVL